MKTYKLILIAPLISITNLSAEDYFNPYTGTLVTDLPNYGNSQAPTFEKEMDAYFSSKKDDINEIENKTKEYYGYTKDAKTVYGEIEAVINIIDSDQKTAAIKEIKKNLSPLTAVHGNNTIALEQLNKIVSNEGAFKSFYQKRKGSLSGWNQAFNNLKSERDNLKLLVKNESELINAIKTGKTNEIINSVKEISPRITKHMPKLDILFTAGDAYLLFKAARSGETSEVLSATGDLIDSASGLTLTILATTGVITAPTALAGGMVIGAASLGSKYILTPALFGSNDDYQEFTEKATSLIYRALNDYQDSYKSIIDSQLSIYEKQSEIENLNRWLEKITDYIKTQANARDTCIILFCGPTETNKNTILNAIDQANHLKNHLQKKFSDYRKSILEISVDHLPLPPLIKNKKNQNWATVNMQNQLSAITNGSTSHIGSASLYTSYNNQQPTANINPTNTNNYQTQTGYQQTAYSTNSQAFQSSDWVMVTGNAATHTAVGNSFGPITAPDGGQIASLNNAGVPYTVITKDFFVPTGTKQVTLTFNGNFVTNEYPTYVGSQYNDYATVKITSPSGNVTPVTAFNQSLNSSNFKSVSGLPTPLDSTGGQTGFQASTATINVAGGGKVTVEVKVANVGDTAVPSAVLLNKVTVK